jgi:putative IMPACT (imprinted ancient) family translation regulator
LLGVPGLINAYKTVSALVLQTVPIIQKQIELTYSVHFDYTQVNDVIQILKQANCTIIRQDLQLFSEIIAGIPFNKLEEVLYRLKELRNVDLKKIL